MKIDEHDAKMIWRCPSLGGEVPFKHCRTTNLGLPCARLQECWQRKLDAVAFIKENYTKEELDKIFAPAPDRLNRILGTLGEFAPKKNGEESSS